MTLSIPMWLLVIIVVLIAGGFLYMKIAREGGGAYDFFTPIAMIAVFGTTMAIVVGILLGKFVF